MITFFASREMPACSGLTLNPWRSIIAAIAAVCLLVTSASAEPVSTFRDDRGQVQGYGSTRGNTTTYSNAMGQQTGRAERSRDGTVHYFNEKGQQIGTARSR